MFVRFVALLSAALLVFSCGLGVSAASIDDFARAQFGERVPLYCDFLYFYRSSKLLWSLDMGETSLGYYCTWGQGDLSWLPYSSTNGSFYDPYLSVKVSLTYDPKFWDEPLIFDAFDSLYINFIEDDTEYSFYGCSLALKSVTVSDDNGHYVSYNRQQYTGQSSYLDCIYFVVPSFYDTIASLGIDVNDFDAYDHNAHVDLEYVFTRDCFIDDSNFSDVDRFFQVVCSSSVSYVFECECYDTCYVLTCEAWEFASLYSDHKGYADSAGKLDDAAGDLADNTPTLPDLNDPTYDIELPEEGMSTINKVVQAIFSSDGQLLGMLSVLVTSATLSYVLFGKKG